MLSGVFHCNTMRRAILIFGLLASLSGCQKGGGNNGLSAEDVKNLNLDSSLALTTKTKNADVIDLNSAFGNEMIEIDNLLDTLFFVPLQTKPENVFYGIMKMVVTEDRFYILDSDERLLIFKSNGDFVKELPQGSGPGELFFLWDFAYDKKNQSLVVAQPNILDFYDKDGNFLESKKCPLISDEILVTDHGFVFVQPRSANHFLGDNAMYSVIITDYDIRTSGKAVRIGNTEGLTRHFPLAIDDGSGPAVSLPGNDTIYSVDNSEISAKHVLLFDDSETAYNGNGDFSNTKKYYHCGGFLENSKTQLITFASPESGFYKIIRDKNTRKMLGGKYTMCSTTIPSYSDVKTVYNDYFVSYINPTAEMNFSSPAISKKDNEKVKNLTEEDNAVLIFFKIKTLE